MEASKILADAKLSAVERVAAQKEKISGEKTALRRQLILFIVFAIAFSGVMFLSTWFANPYKVPAPQESVPVVADTPDATPAETTEEPVIEETTEEPVTETTEEPVAETTEEPVAEETTEEPAVEETTEEPVVEETAEEPATEVTA